MWEILLCGDIVGYGRLYSGGTLQTAAGACRMGHSLSECYKNFRLEVNL